MVLTITSPGNNNPNKSDPYNFYCYNIDIKSISTLILTTIGPYNNILDNIGPDKNWS